MRCRKQGDNLLGGCIYRHEAEVLQKSEWLDGDERLNWPIVTLHIPASELGVMGEKWKVGRWKDRQERS